MSVKKLLHTRMRVNDIEATVKFYEQALGLKGFSPAHVKPRGAQLVLLATPNSAEEIEFVNCWPAILRRSQVQPDLMHLAFRCG